MKKPQIEVVPSTSAHLMPIGDIIMQNHISSFKVNEKMARGSAILVEFATLAKLHFENANISVGVTTKNQKPIGFSMLLTKQQAKNIPVTAELVKHTEEIRKSKKPIIICQIAASKEEFGRKRGTRKKLLATILEAHKDSKYTDVFVPVWSMHDHDFYTKNGFKQVDTYTDIYGNKTSVLHLQLKAPQKVAKKKAKKKKK